MVEAESPAPTTVSAEQDGSVAGGEDGPDTTTRIAAHAVPGIGSLPMRSSDIAVDEDLFTHRTHHPG